MSTKDFSNKQEKLIANYLGWSVVSGSGARDCHPGDIIGDEWLGECKTHEKSNSPIFFSLSVWNKICEEATYRHKNPVLFTDDGSQSTDTTWCITNLFSVTLEDYCIKDFPKNFQKNISFDNSFASELYQKNESTLFKVKFGKSNVAILPLRMFKDIVEEI